MDYSRSDCMLKEILEERKSLTGFLDAVFGFMSRNTDFFHIQKTKDDKLGFPRGVKEQILISCMQKYEHNIDLPKISKGLTIDDTPPAIEEIEVSTEECNEMIGYNEMVNVNEAEILEISKDNKNNINPAKFNESDYRNGSVFKNYCWSQTLKEIELTVMLAKEIKSAKHVKIDLKTNHIHIRTLLPKEEIIISAETWDKYRHNDVVWTITDGKLLLSFDKLKECWWDKLFLNESTIDVKKLDTERPREEYSEETQNVIEKLLLKNEQKEYIKTIPMSESEQMSRLRQAWNAEGSPFKGQPFDPTLVKFD